MTRPSCGRRTRLLRRTDDAPNHCSRRLLFPDIPSPYPRCIHLNGPNAGLRGFTSSGHRARKVRREGSTHTRAAPRSACVPSPRAITALPPRRLSALSLFPGSVHAFLELGLRLGGLVLVDYPPGRRLFGKAIIPPSLVDPWEVCPSPLRLCLSTTYMACQGWVFLRDELRKDTLLSPTTVLFENRLARKLLLSSLVRPRSITLLEVADLLVVPVFHIFVVGQ